MSKDTSEALERLSNSLSQLFDSIAQSGFLDKVTTLVNALTAVVDWVREVRKEFSGWSVLLLGMSPLWVGVEVAITKLGSGVRWVLNQFSALGAWLAKRLMPIWGSVREAFRSTPIVQLIGWVRELVTAGDALSVSWQGVMGVLAAAWELFTSPVRAFFTWLTGTIAQLDDMVPQWLRDLGSNPLLTSGGLQRAAAPASSSTVREVLAPGAGASTKRSEAHLKVEFENLPRGAKVQTTKNTGLDLNLGLGYSMGS